MGVRVQRRIIHKGRDIASMYRSARSWRAIRTRPPYTEHRSRTAAARGATSVDQNKIDDLPTKPLLVLLLNSLDAVAEREGHDGTHLQDDDKDFRFVYCGQQSGERENRRSTAFERPKR